MFRVSSAVVFSLLIFVARPPINDQDSSGNHSSVLISVPESVFVVYGTYHACECVYYIHVSLFG